MLTDPRLADPQTAQPDASMRGGRALGLTVGVWESGRLPLTGCVTQGQLINPFLHP